ncbi:membrane protein [Streptomyces lucensis JCM 4490]|uniref:Membrane protein n=1 Tax=Streptomyces lucensis JCM 4490 TaxID=1306176 RepID=A0A918MRN6_9ACTN|nr:SHOCT domain-containing protein [Streptomyces lucensis]GGW47832.1 membrane protein [Streptomyces lucensis JCM 4490]
MSAQTYLAYDYPLLGVFWTMLEFFLWIIWFVLLFKVIVDIFRDDTLGGWAKAAWTLFVVVLPFLGILVYLIARGRGMGQRELADARAQREAFDSYVRQAAGGGAAATGSADELERLAGMRSRGDITEDEFRRAKDQVLGGAGEARPSDSVPTTSGR